MEQDNSNSTQDSSLLPFPFLFIEPKPETPVQTRPFDIMEKVAQISGRMNPTGRQDKILVISSLGRRDAHAEEIVGELACRGAQVYFMDSSIFLSSSRLAIELEEPGQAPGILELPAGDLALNEVRSVWFRGPDFSVGESTEQMGFSSGFVERETKAALFGLCGVLDHAFWVNHPNAVYAAEDKMAQLKMAQSFGLRIPRTLVTNDPERALRFFEICRGEVIIKTFRRLAFSDKGQETYILTNRVGREHLDQINRVAIAPCLFQEYVPKEIELRVTVIGKRVFAAEIHSQDSPVSRDDYRRYDFANTPYYPHSLPPDVETACLRLVEHYGLAFGAIDMIRRPDGEYVFLEINANAQFLWIQDLTGMPLRETMVDMLLRGSTEG